MFQEDIWGVEVQFHVFLTWYQIQVTGRLYGLTALHLGKNFRSDGIRGWEAVWVGYGTILDIFPSLGVESIQWSSSPTMHMQFLGKNESFVQHHCDIILLGTRWCDYWWTCKELWYSILLMVTALYYLCYKNMINILPHGKCVYICDFWLVIGFIGPINNSWPQITIRHKSVFSVTIFI
jgi:hypothetical protein